MKLHVCEEFLKIQQGQMGFKHVVGFILFMRFGDNHKINKRFECKTIYLTEPYDHIWIIGSVFLMHSHLNDTFTQQLVQEKLM